MNVEIIYSYASGVTWMVLRYSMYILGIGLVRCPIVDIQFFYLLCICGREK